MIKNGLLVNRLQLYSSRGYDERHLIDGVRFQNFRINGAPLNAKSPNLMIQKFVQSLKCN